MVYEIGSNTMLFEVDRASIIDISVGDIIHARGFHDAPYTWKQQDSQFIESNPDAKVFLKIRRDTDGTCEAAGVTIVTEGS
jgi:hypothetical protein